MNFRGLLLVVALHGCLDPSLGFSITDSVVEPNENSVVGGKVRLRCRSSAWFEYCTWKHEDWVCEFEWKWAHNAVKKQTCSALGDRARFVGTYESHECEMEISNLTMSDAGEWSCEMEEHYTGLVRGNTDKAYVMLNIVNNKDTTTPSSPSTTADLATTSSSDISGRMRPEESTEADPIIFPGDSVNVSTTTTTEKPPEGSGTIDEEEEDLMSNGTDSQPTPMTTNEDILIETNTTETFDDEEGLSLTNGTFAQPAPSDIAGGNLIPILVGSALFIVLTTVILVAVLVYRNRRKYHVHQEWKARQEESDVNDDDQVLFTKTSGVEMSAFSNEKTQDATNEFNVFKNGVDMEQNPTSLHRQNSILDNKNALC